MITDDHSRYGERRRYFPMPAPRSTSRTRELRLVLASEVKVSECADNTWEIRKDGTKHRFRATSGVLTVLLRELCRGGLSVRRIAALIAQEGKQSGGLAEQIRRLLWGGFSRYDICQGRKRRPSARIFGTCAPVPPQFRADRRLSLRENAYVRCVATHWVVESAECGGTMEFDDPSIARLVIALRKDASIAGLARRLNLSAAVVRAVVEGLALIGAIGPTDSASSGGCKWSFADELFHCRSRYGTHHGGYGATYPMGQHRPLSPTFKPLTTRILIDLPYPRRNAAMRLPMPLGRALEQRKSVRRHANIPITLDILSAFLYEVCRVKRCYQVNGVGLTARPYPTGGALYELETYVIAARCQGLVPALYRYVPNAHQLERWRATRGELSTLLRGAMAATGMKRPPQLLFIITARFQRLQWKYESIAYSLILKHVGILYQTMYLVATALGLAPCALGGGNAEQFCSIAKTNFWEESSVGEFILGSRIRRDA